ncbi:MAG TPA: hypothetical protein VGJ40_06790 [Gaiellaceae bacterium]|jgi:hypothetical protein
MKLIAAALVALAFPASGAAALEVKLSVVPNSPTKGTPATIQLRPYLTYNRPDGSCCVLKPSAASYPFKVEAVSPNGRVYRVRVRRTKNRYVWSAAFRFRAAGRWVIRAPQWGPRYSRNYGAKPRITLMVAR